MATLVVKMLGISYACLRPIGRVSGTLSCDLMPYSAGLRVGVGGSTVIGWLAGVETKAAKWPGYVTSIARPRGESSSDFPGPFLCMLHFVNRFHALLPQHVQNWLSSISRQAIEPIIVKQGGRFRRLCPSPNLQPQQAPSQATVSAAGHKAG